MNRPSALWDGLHSAHFSSNLNYFWWKQNNYVKFLIYFSIFLAELEKYEKCAEQVGKCFTEWVRSCFLNLCTKCKSFLVRNIWDKIFKNGPS